MLLWLVLTGSGPSQLDSCPFAGSSQTFRWSLASATRECDNDTGWASPCLSGSRVCDFLSILAVWTSENELNKLPVWAWHWTLVCCLWYTKVLPRRVAGFQPAHKSLHARSRFLKSLDLKDAQETFHGLLEQLPLCCPCVVWEVKSHSAKIGIIWSFWPRSGVQVGPGMEGGFTLQRTGKIRELHVRFWSLFHSPG